VVEQEADIILLVVMVVLVVVPEKIVQQVDQEIPLPLVHLKEIMVEHRLDALGQALVEEQEEEVEQVKQE
tara:strand:+ start:239 stop:448 length:210 start_codon:yes stop_codon:yes gene_type:complete